MGLHLDRSGSVTRRRILGLAALAASLLAGGSPALGGEFKATYGEVYAQRDSGPLKADVYVPECDGPFP